jgi:hypothetical protein
VADPVKYVQSYDFSEFQGQNPSTPLPGVQVDIQYAALETSIEEIVEAIKDVRRSDGALKNGVVTADSLDQSVLDLIAAGGGSAATLLAAILTVDGAGSGLDADLLDGANGATYLARANHTGTQTASTISDFSTAADARITAAIGSTVQAYDADLTTWAGLTPSANAQSLVTAANYAAMRALLDLEAGTDFYSVAGADAAFQPLDADLTAIAALATVAAGRSVLTIADPGADRIVAWDDSAGAMAAIALAEITDEASPAAGDFLLIYGAEGDLRKADWSTLPGAGGGISNVVEDETPQLGGNLDLNGFTVGDATAADLTKLNALTAIATELNYVDGVTSAIQTQLDAKQALDADLTSWAGVTRAAGFDTFAATPSSANLASLVTGETGSGALVFGTSPTLTTPAITDPIITGTILEDVFTIVDGAAFEIDPGNGSIQLVTLGANRTPKGTNFVAGESLTLMVDDGTARTLTWTDATWGGSGVVWTGGSAPTLATSGYTVIELWKVGTQVYGAHVGNVA